MDLKSLSNSYSTGQLIAVGTGLAFAAIVLFVLLWFGLGWMGVNIMARLIIAVCAPPGIMTAVLLWIYFTRRPTT